MAPAPFAVPDPPPTPGLFWWRAENPVQANKEQVLLAGKRLPPPALLGQGKEGPRMWGTHPARCLGGSSLRRHPFPLSTRSEAQVPGL